MPDDHDSALRQCLGTYVDPWLGRTLDEVQALRSVRVAGNKATVEVVLGFPAADYAAELRRALLGHASQLGWLQELEVLLHSEIATHAVQRNLQPLKSIRNIVVVASGKGGVGKSTVAANLALAWALQGAKVGILDADVYGPSQPRLMGLTGQRPVTRDGKSLQPLTAHGVEVMSIGFLVDEEQPMVWRGPMVTQALTQLLGDTNWGSLDYLVVDMPPGTGDTQLTMSQRVPLSGAVIVTTPQDIALLDARKGLKMFQKVSVPVLGVVENMSTHVCSKCGHEEHIFGAGGGARLAAQYEVALLGELPLDLRIRECSDAGQPIVAADPAGPVAQAYRHVARRTAARLAVGGADQNHAFPTIVVEDT
ncbi:MAG TPA: iron-sulfur cluster carrier protein ApbC [Steroidobacteraceae bacterium]|jgi:ATP-binding protein involved in chromosome partitioning